MLETFGASALAIVVFAAILIFMMVKSVPQGEEWTVERFGRYTRTLKPGLRFLIPFMDKVGNKVNMMETVLDIESQEVITNARLLSVIDQASNPWGVKVTRVEIKDLKPPKDISDSMARQMKAEREKRAEVLQAEGMKQAAILKAEGLKESQVREAEGRKEAAFRDAEARERSAQAEAEATRMVSEAIAAGDVQAVNYFVAQKYTEALRDMAASPNSKTVLMPLEASSVIGSIAGISELAKAAGLKSEVS